MFGRLKNGFQTTKGFITAMTAVIISELKAILRNFQQFTSGFDALTAAVDENAELSYFLFSDTK